MKLSDKGQKSYLQMTANATIILVNFLDLSLLYNDPADSIFGSDVKSVRWNLRTNYAWQSTWTWFMINNPLFTIFSVNSVARHSFTKQIWRGTKRLSSLWDIHEYPPRLILLCLVRHIMFNLNFMKSFVFADSSVGSWRIKVFLPKMHNVLQEQKPA